MKSKIVPVARDMSHGGGGLDDLGDGGVVDGDGGGGGGGDDLASTGGLTISPTTTSLAFAQSQQFTADRAVTWSVVEAGGGQIAADGRYTAPSVANTFHVHAVATNPAGEATATVTVSEHALTLLAGDYGGLGDADGVGTAARFSSARGMAYDGSRYLYLADAGAVRRLDVTTNAVTTMAGRARWWTGNVDDVGSAARFSVAWSLALDGKGGLYVSDINNSTIRYIELATRKVTTVAGTAGTTGFGNNKGTAATFSSPTGLAFDSAKKLLYIGDANNAAIRIYDPASTEVTTLTNQLTQPDGLAYDGKGTLYVVDSVARQIFTVDTTSRAVTPLAGSSRGFRDGVGAQAHFDWPSQLALEGGALYVGDTLALRKIDLSSTQVTSLPVRGGDARSLIGVLGDGHGHLFVSAESDFAIRRLDAASGADAVVAGPEGLGSGNLDGVGLAARFSNPGHVVADAAGALYVSDVNNAEVRKVGLASAAVSTLVGSAWQAPDSDGVGRQVRMYYPTSIATDHAGTLYIVEENPGTIRKWDSATNRVTALAGRANFPGVADGVGSAARFDLPVAACVDGGALYVADQHNCTIRKITITSGLVETIAGLGEEPGQANGPGSVARFSAPAGIACDGAGHLYVSDGFAIRRIDLANHNSVDTPVGAGTSGYVDMPGTAARFNSPGEMTYANGYLYVIDNGSANLHVRKINVGTLDVQTIASSTLSGQQFYGIAVDAGGAVYVSNQQFGNAGVFKVGNSGALTELAGSNATGNGLVIDGIGAAANFFGAAGMTYDGNALYVAEPAADVARRIDLGNNMVSTPVGLGPDSPNDSGTGSNASLDRPVGLALIDASTLLVADQTSLDSVTLPGASLTVTVGKVGYGGGTDGNGTGASVWPAGLVSDGAGTIYFTGANTVRRYVPATGKVDTLSGQEGVNGSTDGNKSMALFYWPKGIATDGAGNLYVSDMQNHTIRKVVIATGDTSTLAGSAGAFGAVDGVGAAARFFSPVGLVYDGKGNLYVADSENGAIRKIEIATRTVSTYVGVLGQKGLQPGALPAHLNAPLGLALLSDGGLAVTDEQAVLVVH